MSDNALMSTYKRLPIGFQRGEGVWLWDELGRQYLDAVSGIAVCGLGHAHPGLAQALCDQAGTLIHTSNLYRIPHQETLAATLCRLSGMETVFFGNSGAEANEAAIKLARLYGHQRDVADPKIVVMENSFHGRTLATLSATGNRKVQAGFEPLVHGFVRAPYNDIDAVEAIAANNRSVVAVLVEPIQGEGGVNMPDADYLKRLRELCDRHHWLLILDEIQTGMGRTGQWFAFEHSGIQPDVITLAKALGNGVPIGACLARNEAAKVLGPGSHGSTFGGNPLACAAGLAVIDAITQGDLVSRAAASGQALLADLNAALAHHSAVKDIRGLGLIIGIELDRPCTELVEQALEHQLLINVTATNVIRLLPPLILESDHAQRIVDTLNTLIGKL